MNWMNKMNERAHLMGQMLETIGAMDPDARGKCLEGELRTAASRCICCSHTRQCATWLQENTAGATAPFEDCPNAALFKEWMQN